MANVLVERQYLQDIADAIRNKNGTSNKYTPPQMAPAIDALSGGMELDSPTKVGLVLCFPTSLISTDITYEKNLSNYKVLDLQ